MLSPSLPSSHEPCSHQVRPISTAHRGRSATILADCIGDHFGPCISFTDYPLDNKGTILGKSYNVGETILIAR